MITTTNRSDIAAENDRTVLETLFERSLRADRPGKDKYSACEKNEYFEVFVTKQVLKEYKLSPEQMHKGHVGGSNDGGIDSIHLFVDGDWVDECNAPQIIERANISPIDLCLIQAKNTTSMGADPINKLFPFVIELLDPQSDISDVKRKIDSKVIQICTTFRHIYESLSLPEPQINIRFFYVTKAYSPHPDVWHACSHWCKHVEELIPGCQCKCRLIAVEELLGLTRIPIRNDRALSVQEKPIQSKENNCFIALVRLKDYFHFISDHDGSLFDKLFDANVRDWEGKNKVNKQIRKSLETAPVDEFWWLNDGVSILVTEARYTKKAIQLRNPEIINGLQTSRTIHEYFSTATTDINDERRILVRIIELPDDKLKSRQEIIKATNSHTEVKSEDLRSLQKIHYNIQDYLSDQNPAIYYERRKKHYRNQRPRILSRDIITILRLTQSVIATLLLRPEDARKRPGDYLKPDNDNRYNVAFNENYPLQLYHFCAQFYRNVEDFLSRDDRYDKASRRLAKDLKFYIMTHVVLRHLNVPRLTIKSPLSLKDKLRIDDIEPRLLSDSTAIVMRGHRETRKVMGEGFVWKSFEEEFFKGLDEMLPDIKSWQQQKETSKQMDAK
ncbi:MAG: AIPR family protein [Chloroflexi bacterium]|nr:AIPR family protein [Chloroflexota bacterium]